MKTTVLWALVAVNAVLLSTFVNRLTGENAAHAQPAAAAAARRAGDYLMIPADFSGPSVGIVILLDQTTGHLSMISLNEQSPRVSLEVGRSIDLNAIFNAATGQPPRGN
jgi:hypothetical protein